MNRSALDAEVEYHLKAQERARAAARQRHQVTEMETPRGNFLSRIAALFARVQRPALNGQRRRRSHVRLGDDGHAA